MPYYDFFWSDEIIAHIAENGLTREDFERVVCNPYDERPSRSSGLPASFGYTQDGRFIIAVYEFLDDMTVLPVTAYEVTEPE